MPGIPPINPWVELRAKLARWGVKIKPWRTTDAALDGESVLADTMRERRNKPGKTFFGFKVTWRF
jgi:hypothetical protein